MLQLKCGTAKQNKQTHKQKTNRMLAKTSYGPGRPGKAYHRKGSAGAAGRGWPDGVLGIV